MEERNRNGSLLRITDAINIPAIVGAETNSPPLPPPRRTRGGQREPEGTPEKRFARRNENSLPFLRSGIDTDQSRHLFRRDRDRDLPQRLDGELEPRPSYRPEQEVAPMVIEYDYRIYTSRLAGRV